MSHRVPITAAGRALHAMAGEGVEIVLEVEDELLGLVLRQFQALDLDNPYNAEAAMIAQRVVQAIRDGAGG